MSSFKFSLGADAARQQAEELLDNDFGSGFLNLKKIPEHETMYFRVLPFSEATLKEAGSNILSVKKWVFPSFEKDKEGKPKYISTSSPKSLGPSHKKEKDFGDWLVARMEKEVEREHYEKEDGEYTGEPILDENDNEILSLYVEDTENPVVQMFRKVFQYASKAGKKHPVTGEKIPDNSDLRFPDRSSSIEYWIPMVQVDPELSEDEDGAKWSDPVGEPLIVSCPRSVFVQIAGGFYNGAEIPGLANDKKVGHLIASQHGIDLAITRSARAGGKGSNFTVAARMEATGSQSWLDDEYYTDETRIDGCSRLREGIKTEECINAFEILIGDKELPTPSGEDEAEEIASVKKRKRSKAESVEEEKQKPRKRRTVEV